MRESSKRLRCLTRLDQVACLLEEFGAALLFLIAANVGGYAPVAQIGGTIWVGLLSLIVSMPLVISRVKKQALHG